MSTMSGKEILDKFEVVLTSNLGNVGKYLLEQKLNDFGKNKDTFTQEDIDLLIAGLKTEFSKVIGYGIERLENDLRKALKRR